MLGGELFRGLPQAELRRLVSVSTRRRFARHEVVFHRGDPADTLHLILRGRFAARYDTEMGDRMIVAVHGPGDAFGELALVESAPRAATVYALEPAETLCVHRIEFDELRAKQPSVDRMLVTLLANQVRRMDELLTEAYYDDAGKRLLRRLLELASIYDGGDGEVVIPLTQEQLASLAGASRATVSAVLSAERNRGTIALRRGATILLDRESLTRRAGAA